MRSVTFQYLWVEGQWRRDVEVRIDDAGCIAQLSHATGGQVEAGSYVAGLTLPGLADAHCHAFQRVLPPWTQRLGAGRGGAVDDFWSWREAMYAVAGLVTATQLEAITARCYLELLRAGYGGVAEFLYLHRLSDGQRGLLDADMAVAAAAARVGIRLTLLPALYQHGGFGRVPATRGQSRFVRSSAQFLDDWSELERRYPAASGVVLGAAFHSLRAVELDTVVAISDRLLADQRCTMMHLHIAEQPQEVEECLRHYGETPVALLEEHGLLGARWALIHGIHTRPEELECIARSQATLVLCPTTEADLGDGCADPRPLLAAGGRLAIGSDSNIGRSPYAELRQLEWALRLEQGRRNVLASAEQPAVADRLYAIVLAGGWHAVGRPVPGTVGSAADFATFDALALDIIAQQPENALSALVFDAGAPSAQHVMVGGRWLIRDGLHPQQQRIESDYRAAITQLAAPLRSALSG
jgi:formimidoylglutamate deiminase